MQDSEAILLALILRLTLSCLHSCVQIKNTVTIHLTWKEPPFHVSYPITRHDVQYKTQEHFHEEPSERAKQSLGRIQYEEKKIVERTQTSHNRQLLKCKCVLRAANLVTTRERHAAHCRLLQAFNRSPSPLHCCDPHPVSPTQYITGLTILFFGPRTIAS